MLKISTQKYLNIKIQYNTIATHSLKIKKPILIGYYNTVYLFDPMPTIMHFRFHARWIYGVECGLFSNHAPLGQTTLRWDEYLYSVLEKVEVRVTVSVTVCVA